MARNNEAKIEYHYVQQSKNRDTVRTQGRAINSSLKKLKRISSSKLEAVPSAPRDDEPTAQYITIPHDDRIDLRLKEAIEEADEACHKNEAPVPKTNGKARGKTLKRWFGWID